METRKRSEARLARGIAECFRGKKLNTGYTPESEKQKGIRVRRPDWVKRRRDGMLHSRKILRAADPNDYKPRRRDCKKTSQEETGALTTLQHDAACRM